MSDTILTEDDVLARLPERIVRELIVGHHAHQAFAEHEQAKVSRALEAAPPQHHIEGFGQRLCTIARGKAAELRVKHGQDCLHDPAFIRWLQKNDASFRNGSVSKTTLRVDGLKR